MKTPRSEYPRPQFVRPEWLCLNGEWEFEIDQGDSGFERGLLMRPLAGSIRVPFCPESELSGVTNTDFLNAVWYRRCVTIPAEWGGRVPWLHFQAVDYDATVWVNGVQVGQHRGGFSPFSCKLTGVKAGKEIEIVLRARDFHLGAQPRGKQSQRFGNHSCFYPRTTGIWQTVWLEPLPEYHLKRARITPDVAGACFRIEQPLSASRRGLRLNAFLRDGSGIVAESTALVDGGLCPTLELRIPAGAARLWSPEDPHLYELELVLLDEGEEAVDRIASYAGLRGVRVEGKAILINERPVFQRLVLDQGFYPDGLLTAPSEEALVADIRLSLDAGFNGARLHQKVFEERFLYHADRMGYLVWGEFADWGCETGPREDRLHPASSFITEWLEVLDRDYSHPSIIGWCPLNETAQPLGTRLHEPDGTRIQELDSVTRGLFLATKAMDRTRPVLDASGYSHRVAETDVYDSHDYEQDPVIFAKNHAGLVAGNPFVNAGAAGDRWSLPYCGQPYFVSEFGGIWWNPKARPGENSWGYGDRPKTLEEFYERFDGLCRVLLGNPEMFGYCYTQLTDVFQEQNGIYHFDRSPKFDMRRIRQAQRHPSAFEEASGSCSSRNVKGVVA